jgi:hypothetical protein
MKVSDHFCTQSQAVVVVVVVPSVSREPWMTAGVTDLAYGCARR